MAGEEFDLSFLEEEGAVATPQITMDDTAIEEAPVPTPSTQEFKGELLDEFEFPDLDANQKDETQTLIYEHEGVVPEDDGRPQVAKGKLVKWLNQQTDDRFVAAVDPDVASRLGKGDTITWSDVGGTLIEGTKETWGNSNDSFLWKALTTLSIGEQAMARATVAALANDGHMSMSDARAILSQDEVHASQIVDYYYKADTNKGEVVQFGAGLAADILLDPLTYLTFGASALVKVGGKAYNMTKYGQLERKVIQQARKIERVIEEYPAPGAKGLKDKAIASEQLGNQLNLALKGDEGAKEFFLRNPIAESTLEDKLLKEKTYSFKMRLAVPFTRHAKEIELSGLNWMVGKSHTGIKWASGQFAEAVDKAAETFVDAAMDLGTYQRVKSEIAQSAPVQKLVGAKSQLGTMFTLFRTQTDFPEFNTARVNHVNTQRLIKETNLREEAAAYEALKGADEDFLAEITDNLENILYYDKDGMIRQVDYMDNIPIDANSLVLSEKILNSNLTPAVREFMAKQINDNKRLTAEYKKRFPDFTGFQAKDMQDATGYVKHFVNRDWYFKDKYDEMMEALDEATKVIENYGPATDMSARKRRLSQTIKQANAAMAELGYQKVLIDDPVKLHFMRKQEMERMILNHDTLDQMKYLVTKERRVGYEPLIPKEEMKYIKLFGKKDKPEDIWGPQAFYPQWLKDEIGKLKGKDQLYIPRDVAIRLDHLVNSRNYSGTPGMAFKALAAYNHLFRSATLYGPGYLGQNFFSNLITYTYAGGDYVTGTKIANSWALGLPVTVGGKKYTHAEWVDLLSQNGILQNSLVDEVKWDHIVGNMGGRSYDKRVLKLKKGAKPFVELATGYRTSRYLARVGDDMPKIMFFASKLDEGYSIAGAREATDYWFFNFSDVSPNQKIARQIMPFTTFAMKTAEQSYGNLKSGRWGSLTFPEKVSNVIEGMYVDDPGTREYLDDNLPQYRKFWHNVHGPILPGGREILLDLPWASSTLTFLFHPNNSIHPLFKVIGLAADGRSSGSEIMDQHEFDLSVGNELKRILPPPIRHALSVAELRGMDVPGYGLNKSQDLMITGDIKLGDGVTYNATASGAAFGKFLRENYGDNPLYSFFFYGDFKDRSQADDTVAQMVEDARYGRYIKGFFRDVTLGFARIEELDRNAMFNYKAIDRASKNVKKEFEREQQKAGGLHSAEIWNDESAVAMEKLKRQPRLMELYSEHLALEEKKSALLSYWGFYMYHKEKSPGLFRALFGLDEDKFDFENAPQMENVFDVEDLREKNIQEFKEQEVEF